AQMAVAHVCWRWHEDGNAQDNADQYGEPEPDFFSHVGLPFLPSPVTKASSFSMSSLLTSTISMSLSTSTSSTSLSREGHFPSRRQRTQYTISTKLCSRRQKPASGMMALNG